MQNGRKSRVQLLGLPGSLRANSYSRAVLRGIAAVLPQNITLTIGDVRLPLYNQDDDVGDGPPDIYIFRKAVAMSGGIVIATPEYSYGIPGVLKNALDWVSRPLDAAALKDKPVVIMSVSREFTGGVRAQAQVHDALLAARARITGGPQIVIGNVVEKIASGLLVDESSLAFALSAIARLVESIELTKITHPRDVAIETYQRGGV